jgi:dihydrofolate reductase
MGRVVVLEFVSLDGVMEAPDKWHLRFWHEEMGKYKYYELFASDVLLLGRVTYEGFAAAWPTRAGDDDFADRMNGLPNCVVSTTLEEPLEWNNSRLIKENVAEEISRLKQQPGRDILIAGSVDLVNTLMSHGLIDEYRLMVHPVVVGSGKRLFREGSGTTALRLVETKRFGGRSSHLPAGPR